MKYIDVNGILRDMNDSQDRFFRYIYGHAWTRALLKPLLRPGFSRFAGFFMDRGASRVLIRSFIRKNGIDMTQFEERRFASFNDFFTRAVLPDKRPLPDGEKALFSPCDAYLTVLPVTEDLRFTVKHTEYSLSEFLQSEETAEKFNGGTLLLYRLSVQHYHRYHFFDSGKIEKEYRIPGALHTVQPSANDARPIYKENTRCVSVLSTEHFGMVIQTEVGALLVGRITNNPVKDFKRGDEKGRFEFGGSTVIVVLEKDAAEIDGAYINASKDGLETEVRFGTRIGRSLKP
ncbi:MAG: phosphatidylserine decarboxylase [Lachnospiraceae bacterium]|nr:phosphatidylserine decarboxylase [Lachnospiraceae bacterium]